MRRSVISAAIGIAAAVGLFASVRRRRRSVSIRREPTPGAPRDRVTEAGLESFPASDPPGWTLGE